jgi:hypothetical protein
MGRRNREASNTEEVYESRGLGKNQFFQSEKIVLNLLFISKFNLCIYLCWLKLCVSKFDLHSILRLAAW